MTFDPRKDGADCDNCPFNGQTPVPSHPSRGHPKLTIILDYPGDNEIEKEAPIAGGTYWTLKNNLRARGVELSNCHVTNTILCKPASNTKKKKPSKKQMETAARCCSGRLLKELNKAHTPNVFAMGELALSALTGKDSVDDYFGYPLPGVGVFKDYSILPCFHPKMCYAQPQRLPVLKIMIDRAKLHAAGEYPTWRWGRCVVASAKRDNDDEITSALKELKSRQRLTVDIENLGSPLFSRIRCVGIGDRALSVAVPFEPAVNPVHLQLLRELLENPTEKVGHNIWHDITGLSTIGINVAGKITDTILKHATVAPQLRHKLSMATIVELMIERWKSDFERHGDDNKGGKKGKAVEVYEQAPLEVLSLYCCKDVQATDWLNIRLDLRMDATNNAYAIYEDYSECARIAAKMSAFGVKVDEQRRASHRVRIVKELNDYYRIFAKLVPDGKYTLGAAGLSKSLNRLFFNEYKVTPTRFNKETGEPKLDAAALQDFVAADNIPIEVKKVARCIIFFRRWYKLLSTYIDGMPIMPDGRVHPMAFVIGAKTGRWSYSDPNLQNIPKSRYEKQGDKQVEIQPGLRDLFVADEGKWIVAADYSQLELRIATTLWQIKNLLQWYKEGRDVHAYTAEKVFGPSWTNKDRDMAKRVYYGVLYNESDDVHAIWQSLVVDNPGLPYSLIARVRRDIFALNPEIQRGQDDTLKFAREHNYIRTPLLGRQVTFHDGFVDANVALNHPIQGMAAELANRAIRHLDKLVNWKDEHILWQCHDEIAVSTNDYMSAARKLKESMELPVEWNGQTYVFPCEVKFGKSWGNMEKIKL